MYTKKADNKTKYVSLNLVLNISEAKVKVSVRIKFSAERFISVLRHVHEGLTRSGY